MLNCLETIEFQTAELTFEETYRKGIEHIQKYLQKNKHKLKEIQDESKTY